MLNRSLRVVKEIDAKLKQKCQISGSRHRRSFLTHLPLRTRMQIYQTKHKNNANLPKPGYKVFAKMPTSFKIYIYKYIQLNVFSIAAPP